MQSRASTDKSLKRLALKADRSCIVCHRRKVRCDKKSPCSNCTRTGVLCHYPSSNRPVPRQPKTTISEIATRLLQLERTIIAVSNDRLGAASEDKTATRASSSLNDDDIPLDESQDARTEVSEAGTRDEILIGNGFSGRYINEALLCRVLEEEEEIISVLADPWSPDEDDSRVHAASPGFQFLGLFSGDTEVLATDRFHALHPTIWQGMQLWQAFTQNVDPLCKVVHIPTAQIKIFSALNNPREVGFPVVSLLFAIYFSAVISLGPSEVEAILGQKKKAALERFKLGLERSLVQGNFLECPTLTTLQALAVFLKTACAYNTGRSTWVLYGLAIRLAQSIGLHRESVNFHLSPFDTEMRRRTWWLLAGQEWRATEDHGISVINLDSQPAIGFPLNVSDSGLDPTMTELPLPNHGWTEMTFPLVILRVNDAIYRLYRLMQSSRSAKKPYPEEERVQIVSNTTQRVEQLLEGCNPVIPIQRVTLLLSRKSLRKLAFVSRQLWQASTEGVARGQGGASRATEENLSDACDVLDVKFELMADEQLRNYRWAGEAYSEYHVMLYVLWHLCVEPQAAGAKRAWTAVDRAFELEEARRARQESASASKWAALTMLRDKATRIRDSTVRSQDRRPAGKAVDVETLSGGTVLESGGFTADSLDDMGAWDGGFLDWDSFINDLGPDEFSLRPE